MERKWCYDMVIGAFGLPRCGKTTWLAKVAFEERQRIYKGTSKYQNIVSTTQLMGCDLVSRETLVNKNFYNTLILIDEVSLFFGNRDWKQFGERATHMFNMHGHYGNQIIWASQKVDDIDVKVFAVTERLYYVRKSRLTKTTKLYLCPHVVVFDEKTARPIQGFGKPKLLSRLFAVRVDRPAYYDLFDTHAFMDSVLYGHQTYASDDNHVPFAAITSGC